MKHLPLFTLLRQKKVLVTGSDESAVPKIHTLLKANADIHVVGEKVCEQVRQWSDAGQVTLYEGQVKNAHFDGCWLVVAAFTDTLLNKEVLHTATERCLWCNVVDDPDSSTFIFPSIIDRSPIVIAISSAGVAPVLARRLKSKIENIIPLSCGPLAELLGRWGSQIKKSLPAGDLRRAFWARVFSSDISQFVEQGLIANAESKMASLLDQTLIESPDTRPAYGHVSLVGAGPGDAELLTIKAQQRIQAADIIFYDALVDESILQRTRRDAQLVFVGKRAGAHSTPQESIERQLVVAAQKGLRIVRLKGGDPFVFGRGGEELTALSAAGITFDVVPGITAAAASAAYIGVSLTHRDYAQSAILVTGHNKEDGQLDWSLLAKSHQTLAIYMGLQQSRLIQQQLIQHGRHPETPIAIIENATSPKQRSFGGRLAKLANIIDQYQIKAPAMILIGEVCCQLGDYHWFGTSYVNTELSVIK